MTSTSVLVNAQYAAVNKTRNANFLMVKQSSEDPYAKPPGLRMRNTGRTLTILGGAMLIGGIIMASSADDLYYNSTYSSSGSYSEGDPQGAVGVLMIAGGVGMAIPGIIFWTKGAKKYRSHLENERASINIKGTHLALLYQF